MSTHEELRAIALSEFASAGYAATSLQRIAELAGVSKSSVLYHFASKEQLLESVIGPALDRMDGVLALLENSGSVSDSQAFLEVFVDFLLLHRLEVNMFINQGPSLVDVPVVDRANSIVARLATFFSQNTQSLEDNMRFGIALGGAAYMLCTTHAHGIEFPADETRAALITIMSELLAPVSTR
ncbi:helix-turn-helix domain-containing protein [Salinibacterium sp. G-O1]|uniref:TetR/AcrR family transcriptional regulator n=1 Tax=Salinibacterium sp. G-O1 TaxID=3046208 RepID=UPI0024B9E0F0|nr:TetR/AcrR family transcriptional regulator [Salinibacterium sp. G-O1]MDJ0336218.1 helix-turn-helix domain-containing protein [Salinibacterium sp. G-O1]